MIEECNFKSKIRHRDSPGCNLTLNDIVCPGEENCILYQIYKNMGWVKEKISLDWLKEEWNTKIIEGNPVAYLGVTI